MTSIDQEIHAWETTARMLAIRGVNHGLSSLDIEAVITVASRTPATEHSLSEDQQTLQATKRMTSALICLLDEAGVGNADQLATAAARVLADVQHLHDCCGVDDLLS